MKQGFCWEGVKDTKKVYLNSEVKDFKIYRSPPLMSSSVVTFKISRMFSLNLKPGIRLDIKKEQVKTHANLLKV